MHANAGKPPIGLANETPDGAAVGAAGDGLNRRGFLKHAAVISGAVGIGTARGAESAANEPERLRPIGQAKGVHPGRVVWVHDPRATCWKGPGNGHWYEASYLKQDRVDEMASRAVRELTGQPTLAKAWDQLFRHLNQARGKGDIGYTPGEKLVIKPNWVGLVWRWGTVDPKTYTLIRYQDYMNTSPQAVIALVRQLVSVGVKEADITVCDSLAYLVHEFYDMLHKDCPSVQYVDYGGKFGRIQVQLSSVPIYWSCRPEGKAPDYVPTRFAAAEYVINLASLKSHETAGVTLCGKNHFGSLVRWPAQKDYYDMHRGSRSRQTKVYREQVDLMGHSHLGGKTVLYMIDGFYSGKHPIDRAPRRWTSAPFGGHWTSSLLASQDPVAIDSVGFDFLWTEWQDHAHMPGADDYLHEAALAASPPSGTFYDPDHPTPVKRLASLGVHEHWNSGAEKKYSRNLGTGQGIELMAVNLGEAGPTASD